MTTRILHATCPYTNIGDGALNRGIRTTLREAHADIEFVSEDILQGANGWGNKVYDRRWFEGVENEYDLLLIGGGGIIDSNRKSTLSGMMFHALPEDLKRCNIPIVFYGVGHNGFRNMGYHNADRLLEFLDVVLNSDHILFSVRNDGSKGRLERMLGHASDRILEIPDPGVHVDTVSTYYPQIRPDATNVLIGLSGDRPGYRFDEFGLNLFNRKLNLSNRRERRFMTGLANAMQAVAVDRSINYVMAPHLPTDYAITGAFVSAAPIGLVRYGMDATGVLRGMDYAPQFFDLYRQADLILGMRGHAVICAVGLQRPFIGLVSHDKVREFLRAAGLERYQVEVLDPNIDEKLAGLMRELLDDPSEYHAACSRAMDRFREQTRTFNQQIFGLLGIHSDGRD